MGKVGPGKEKRDHSPGTLPEIERQKSCGVSGAVEQVDHGLYKEAAFRTEVVGCPSKQKLVVLQVAAEARTESAERGTVDGREKFLEFPLELGRGDAEDPVRRGIADALRHNSAMDASKGQFVVFVGDNVLGINMGEHNRANFGR